MDWNTVLTPILEAIGTAVGVAIVAGLNKLLSLIHNNTAQTVASRLVSAAENPNTSPQTGVDKKAWVMAELTKEFPKMNVGLLSAFVEGAVQEMNVAQPGLTTVISSSGIPLSQPSPDIKIEATTA